MAGNVDLTQLLRRCRGRIAPESLGRPERGAYRRVLGLRREEAAQLAGVSTDYYIRLEQGRNITPSDSVLDAVADALGLDAGRYPFDARTAELVGELTMKGEHFRRWWDDHKVLTRCGRPWRRPAAPWPQRCSTPDAASAERSSTPTWTTSSP
ncbi:helix-turn-helix domain-containing protein [Streptomyces sp. NPDC056749]|uniref:helix-turn-helix domain-containing protein n=1 Tax=Streptomyces sp. NPDC056749 TaxID=3345936 RepID=UPI00367EFB9B